MLVGVVNAPTRYSPVKNPEQALARRNTVIARMEAAGALGRREADSISALPIILNYKPVSHNEGQATYFREMLRLVMNAERPVRRQFLNDWDYEQAVREYDENPLYGWCHKNTKADGTPYNIYRDGLKIYTTVNSAMQTYAEQAVQKQMETVIQPQMDAQYKRTKTLFLETTRQERERIMANAIRYSDRYHEMKAAGIGEREILASFEQPCPMKVFTYKGERDTVMTPRDSILHHKRILRASFVAIDPRTGFVKAYVGGPNFRYFKYDMAKQGKRQIGSTIKPFVYAQLHRPCARALPGDVGIQRLRAGERLFDLCQQGGAQRPDLRDAHRGQAGQRDRHLYPPVAGRHQRADRLYDAHDARRGGAQRYGRPPEVDVRSRRGGDRR